MANCSKPNHDSLKNYEDGDAEEAGRDSGHRRYAVVMMEVLKKVQEIQDYGELVAKAARNENYRSGDEIVCIHYSESDSSLDLEGLQGKFCWVCILNNSCGCIFIGVYC